MILVARREEQVDRYSIGTLWLGVTGIVVDYVTRV